MNLSCESVLRNNNSLYFFIGFLCYIFSFPRSHHKSALTLIFSLAAKTIIFIVSGLGFFLLDLLIGFLLSDPFSLSCAFTKTL